MDVTAGLKPASILLIEDNPADVELVKLAFEESRLLANLMVVEDGNEAADYIQNGAQVADVVLLDINLPTLDGFTLLAMMRGHPRWEHVPVVMLTSSRSEEDIVRSYEGHVNAYISKPFEFAELVEAVRDQKTVWFAAVAAPAGSAR